MYKSSENMTARLYLGLAIIFLICSFSLSLPSVPEVFASFAKYRVVHEFVEVFAKG